MGMITRWAGALLVLLVAGTAPMAAQQGNPDSARIETGDVTRFLSVLDALRTARSYNDSALILFQQYYLPGSPGLRAFIRLRVGSPFELLDQMTARHDYYAHLPESLARLAETRTDIRAALRRFKSLWADARFGDTYFLVGRMNSGGTVSRNMLLIGAEMYGKDAAAPTGALNAWEKDVLADLSMVPTIVVHELMHFNQPVAMNPNLLVQALREGGADFVAERVTGRNINAHVHAWAAPREAALWEEFQAAMHGSDFSRWFGNDSPERPADTGNYIGYKIAEAHYQRSADKSRALGEILRVSDADAFLVASGYNPHP